MNTKRMFEKSKAIVDDAIVRGKDFLDEHEEFQKTMKTALVGVCIGFVIPFIIKSKLK